MFRVQSKPGSFGTGRGGLRELAEMFRIMISFHKIFFESFTLEWH